MSHEHEQDLLARTLRERSDTMAGAGVDLDAVRGRARGIRRRRRAGAGIVAAAVLGVAVPVGLDAIEDTRGTAPSPVGPTPTVVDSGTPDPSPDPVPRPAGPVVLDGAAAPRGDDPAVGYLDGRTLHRPDGSTLELARPLAGLAPYQGEGWIGFDWGTGRTYVLDPSGAEVESSRGIGTAVGLDDDLAWTLRATGGRDLLLGSSTTAGTPLSTTVAPAGQVFPVGFTARGQVAYTLQDEEDGTTTVHLTDFVSRPTRVDGLLTARDANPATGTLVGLTEVDDLTTQTCSALVDAATLTERWETCDRQLEEISPDGRYVLAVEEYSDGIGGTEASILDAADGTVLAEYEVADRSFTNLVRWESDASALVSVFQDGTWYLLRIRPDGSLERALDPVEASEVDAPWQVVAQP